MESAKAPKGKIPKEEDFNCINCKEMIVEPRLLDCMHSICLECAKKIAVVNEQKKEILIECKSCQNKNDWTTIQTMEKEEIRNYVPSDIYLKEKAKLALKRRNSLEDAFLRKLKNFVGDAEDETCLKHPNEPVVKICRTGKCLNEKLCKKCISMHSEYHEELGDDEIIFQSLHTQSQKSCQKHKN